MNITSTTRSSPLLAVLLLFVPGVQAVRSQAMHYSPAICAVVAMPTATRLKSREW